MLIFRSLRITGEIIMPFDFTDNGQQMDLFPGCRIRQRQLSRFFNSFVSVLFRLGLRRFILVLIVIFLILHGLFPPSFNDFMILKI